MEAQSNELLVQSPGLKLDTQKFPARSKSIPEGWVRPMAFACARVRKFVRLESVREKFSTPSSLGGFVWKDAVYTASRAPDCWLSATSCEADVPMEIAVVEKAGGNSPQIF